ncbi:hypothetical protein GCM10022239_27340 [Leifsonia bigeumensis]|uniref:Lipoprotein n=1 Tax=Leifsonella bigeumensis TaxID=433643 RepID=A0ABP7FX95_9MICO
MPTVASALAVAFVLVLAGCTVPEPEPASDCSSMLAAEDAIQQQHLQGRLDTDGLWSWTWDNPPTADDLTRPVAVPAGFDPNRRIWLTSIQLAPGVSGEVSILSPRDARLFVSTWDRWGSLTAYELLLGARRGVRLPGCDGYASYPALTIVDGPECVVFAVQQDGDERMAQIRVPFFGAEC